MTNTGRPLLIRKMARVILENFETAEPGDCQRIDDVSAAVASELATVLMQDNSSVLTHILSHDPSGPVEINAERAVEIRNRKVAPLLLLVPSGEGHAASSLDNSFQRTSVQRVFHDVEPLLMDELSSHDIADVVRRNTRVLRPRQSENWAEFLAELCLDPSPRSFGMNLWRLGLIPDAGEDPWARIEKNRLASRAISRPTRPTASIDDRLTAAGLREGKLRSPLRAFFSSPPASLADPNAWGRAIAEDRSDLTFDRWAFVEAAEEDLDSLQIEPFIRVDGTLDKTCKLALGEDEQLVLTVPEDGAAPLVLRWSTDPPKVKGIEKWQISILPPDDIRSAESESLATKTVKGDKRRATVQVEIDAEALSNGSRFVAVLTALGASGETIQLSNGVSATADSQEFQVVSVLPGEKPAKRKAASSLPESRVRAALDGMDDLSEDLVSWDMDGQVFGVRLGNRRSVQIRISPLLIKIQKEMTSAPAQSVHFSARASHGVGIDHHELERKSLALPDRLKKTRADFLTALYAREPRDTIESVSWDEDLTALAATYLSTYRRAIDAAEGEALNALLLLDSLSLSIRRSSQRIRAVVLPAIHPLRIAWAAEHDRILSQWANDLLLIDQRGARSSMVDAQLLARVVPANFPFTVLDNHGDLAYYVEELTHGAGVFVVPGVVDSEAAAESVASVMGLTRIGSSLTASSTAVGDRILGYESSHNPSETLSILSVHPGSGDLLDGALRRRYVRDEGLAEDTDVEEPRRLEIVCYTDSPGFARPVPALMDLQASLRRVESSRKDSHLFPPMSLSVRPTDRFLEDEKPAHLALVQDVGAPGTAFASEESRVPSFGELLVPLVTRAKIGDDHVSWQSVPTSGSLASQPTFGLAAAHRTHQRGIGRCMGFPQGKVPAVEVALDGDRLAEIRMAHQRADWVIGVDRFVGVDLYEGPGRKHLSESYILDYAPDFIEGIGERLTVTTGRREEVEAILEMAMRELHLEAVNHSVGNILSTLSMVSGRLALRLLDNSSQARESVSLAAVISHLQRLNELENVIVIPVDAHPEIFAPASRDGSIGTRRCDLLLVKITQRSFKIECVEVKSRQEARVPQALADQIVEQLQDTERLLNSLFFATDPPRIDAELQAARLSSLLHFYADRSLDHGLIDPERARDVHHLIDRIEENNTQPQISLKGYVISLDGDAGFKKRYGDVSVSVLTSEDLGQIGISTVLNEGRDSRRTSVARDEVDTSTNGTAYESSSDLTEKRKAVTKSIDSDSAGGAGKFDAEPDGASTRSISESGLGAREGSSDVSQPDPGPIAKQDSNSETDREQSTDGPATSEAKHEDFESHEGPDRVDVVLGQTENESPVVWSVSTQGSPHAFVLGIPGQGKSVTTRKIIRDFSEQGLPALIFDFHGDMAGNPPKGANVLNAADGLPFNPLEPDVSKGRPINVTAWEIAEIIGYVAKLGEIQRNHVYKALVAAYANHGWDGTTKGSGIPSLHEFGAAVESVESGAKGRNARDRLRPFTDFGLFQDDAEGQFEILSNSGGLVVDVSNISLEEVQRFAASFLLRRVYKEMFTWGQSGKMRLAVVLDEAHRLARDVTLPKLMKEGRKYGVSVVVASQGADDFHDDVLGNAGAKVVFRTNFPASKSVAGFLRGRSGTDLSEQIERLGVGVAYVSTPDAAQARKVYMQT